MSACIFCRIIKAVRKRKLVIPKYHGSKLLDIPDEHLTEVLPVLKKLAKASGATDYNILQNNGALAHQQVDHVHFHMVHICSPPRVNASIADPTSCAKIPKPSEKEGLGINWPAKVEDMEKLKAVCEDIKSKM
ncbi:hypothetical protein CP533_5359 [Ophiocordyceps camponoti-saundersi (nom. inval.)]|nr:hypothetical protein CP533_5359 [Ophiocordyceps camponoti-saundersi (nom. inval.)]